MENLCWSTYLSVLCNKLHKTWYLYSTVYITEYDPLGRDTM